MSGQAAQQRIDKAAQKYAERFRSGEWTLEVAHKMLREVDGRTLFETAGLAKAIACFQCSE